ncbi:iron-sulfur cluster co-chaperone HscB C-terminal domain-containing protein [Pedobacter faecalis]|uniref:iron-sulfur cluster co-chaperone HscB C-terminal domain-containing protein n=1 Tax=Pedobacter faecalis TaxID=3041495 RepID=UPI00254E88D3|nr:iron-sulfur cluster co-chaperone HscB C-terminal domain-containing protein [Pedobacter sp. ELA7]
MTDYFAFYGLPLSFNPDQELVKQQYYALSKRYHPDFYINESEEKQSEVLELSTLNNKAYQVLSNRERLIQYVLELEGVISEGENYALPQDFLMDMMDINESLMDLSMEPDAERLALLDQEVAAIEQGLSAHLDERFQEFAQQEGEARAITLQKIKDLYYRGKYLQRLRGNISKAMV